MSNLLAPTAGRAKKEMAKTEKQEATILPTQVLGTVSPYPIVVTVIYEYTILETHPREWVLM